MWVSPFLAWAGPADTASDTGKEMANEARHASSDLPIALQLTMAPFAFADRFCRSLRRRASLGASVPRSDPGRAFVRSRLGRTCWVPCAAMDRWRRRAGQWAVAVAQCLVVTVVATMAVGCSHTVAGTT